MKNVIFDKLKSLEEENNVRIPFSCESGSRAWGLLLRTATMTSALYMFTAGIII